MEENQEIIIEKVVIQIGQGVFDSYADLKALAAYCYRENKEHCGVAPPTKLLHELAIDPHSPAAYILAFLEHNFRRYNSCQHKTCPPIGECSGIDATDPRPRL